MSHPGLSTLTGPAEAGKLRVRSGATYSPDDTADARRALDEAS